MQNNYIIRLKDDTLACIYCVNDRSILLKKLILGKWSKEEILLDNALGNFTVNISSSGDVYIFCQDTEGSIILLTNSGASDDDQYQSRVILKNQSDTVHTILFYSFIQANHMGLIYNIPGEDKSYKLISQSLTDTGSWTKPQHIDSFLPMREKMFHIQSINYQHYVAYYKPVTKENTIGYREIAPDRWGTFNIIHQTAYQITDASFLTTATGIHALYIVKSMFSCQLLYRRKDSATFTPVTVVYENPRIENCILFIIKNNIYAAFMLNGQLYLSVSTNNGINFSRPEIYRNKFCKNPIKASYVSTRTMNEDDFLCWEVYVDQYNPWDIQILPDICDDFIPLSAPLNTITSPSQNINTKNLKESADGENPYKRVEQLINENMEKDEQLLYLSNMVKDRGRRLDEAHEAEDKMKQNYNKKFIELKGTIETLEKENARLLEEIKLLSLRTTKSTDQAELEEM